MIFSSVLKSAALVSAFLSAVNGELKTVELTHPYGSSAEIFLFGAQVKSFHPAMSPQLNVLFMSKDSFLTGKKPIRGGITVNFPNCGHNDVLPVNGFARTTNWNLASMKIAENHASPSVATFKMASSETTQTLWLFEFELEYEVRLYGNQLETALHVHNTFTKEIKFQTSLTNYVAVDNVLDGDVTLTGLVGVDYVDRVNKVNETETREFLNFTSDPFSLLYVESPDELVTTIRGVSTVDRTVTVKKKAFITDEMDIKTHEAATDAVVWNPGAEGAEKLKDLGDDEYINMIAIEPGRISVDQALGVNKTYTLQQSISVTSY